MDAVTVSGMNEKNDSALVTRPSSAVEKDAPGAKRVLASMVADTLALARNETSPAQVLYRRGLFYEEREDF
jgi:hypothetical protein